jgi:hypothetical protein
MTDGTNLLIPFCDPPELSCRTFGPPGSAGEDQGGRARPPREPDSRRATCALRLYFSPRRPLSLDRLTTQHFDMKFLRRIVLTFGAFVLGMGAVAAAIFPFTSYHGISGFALLYIYLSLALALVGGFMLMGSGSDRVSSPGIGDGTSFDERVVAERDKDSARGTTLGTELFCIGAICAALAGWLYSVTS